MNSRLSAARRARSATEWVASLSPWPPEFGLDRMHALLERLGNPERRFEAIHVVGTNGKSTATRTIAVLLRAAGRRAAAYTSPHVSGWAERIWIDGAEVDFERAVARVRADAEAVGATQFEALTAAAFAEFAARGVDGAAVEAGLGGRLDATNVIDAPVVLLTNVSLDHTEVLGDTRDQIAREKLAVAHAARVVVLPDNEWLELAAELSPNTARIVTGGAQEATEALLGRALDVEVAVRLPGRLERRGRELWDGAHNAAGARWLRAHLGGERVGVVVASVLSNHYTDEMLAELGAIAPRMVATQSANPQALAAGELADRARRFFATVELDPNPERALERAREATSDTILVTGSLYLLADLLARRKNPYDAEAG